MKKKTSEPKLEELEMLEVFQTRDKNRIKENHQKYLASGEWKCPASPTGAHHMLEKSTEFQNGISKRIFMCKFCDKRQLIIRRYNLEAKELGHFTRKKVLDNLLDID